VQAQAAVVGRFRTGELNVLIATNVGSEGMDFQQCELVVAFEPPQNVTLYIQVWWRALHWSFCKSLTVVYHKVYNRVNNRVMSRIAPMLVMNETALLYCCICLCCCCCCCLKARGRARKRGSEYCWLVPSSCPADVERQRDKLVM
jgi:hypothetical protein